eukprot:m.27158 g.27158  ORF g.27158 m.27158 type:complete len:493 (-) comp10040_c0_seq2:267-1745(-)
MGAFPSKGGRTRLFIAAEQGNEAAVDALIAANVDVDKADKRGWTPLHTAASHGHEKVVQMLIAAKCNIDQLSREGRPPLFIAISRGHVKIVQMLIAAGANVGPLRGRNTPLLAAGGNEALVRIIMAANPNLINIGDQYGTTPLHQAAESGMEKVLQILIAAKADIEQTDRSGATPLFDAAKGGQEKTMQILIAAKANVNVVTYSGCTPLYVAAAMGHLPVVKALVAAGAKQLSMEGKSPIDVAKENGHGEIAAFLTAAGGPDRKLAAMIANLKLTGQCESALRQLGISEVQQLSLVSEADLVSHGCTSTVARTLLYSSSTPTASQPQPTSAAAPKTARAVTETTTTDVFIAHSWDLGADEELGRDNHARVGKLNKALQARGVRTWFDAEQMSGHISMKMQEGIKNARFVLVCVTQRYCKKVAVPNAEDYASMEFDFASRKSKMIPIVMEPRMCNSRLWHGQLEFHLGGRLFYDFTTDDKLAACVESIIKAIQ